MSEKVQYHVIVYGKVQGVFFRAETSRAAQKLNITGWVRNLANGTVETFIEGDETDIHKMIQWLKKGSPLSSVSKIDLQKSPSCSDFTSFKITG
ncbi:MAG: acylphosphatase [Thermodesulfobacteriota bacterium]|nr:acylphosphatase [Thermodesulfobacteriota bacterium]